MKGDPMSQSTSQVLSVALSMAAPLNLEQLKKRAKELKRSVDDGSIVGAVRIQRSVPGRDRVSVSQILSEGVKLSEAQLVVAREAGYVSWPRLRQALEFDNLSDAECTDVLVKACIGGDSGRVQEILATRKNLVRDSLAVALCIAASSAPGLLATGDIKDVINDDVGPLNWPALMYVCASRFGADDADIRRQRRDLAAQLIELGADVNAGVKEASSPRGYSTVLGAAIGQAEDVELARLLLDAGADIDDGPTLYEGCAMWEAVRHQNTDSLDLLLSRNPPVWHRCHALPQSLQFNHEAMVDSLLANEADPNWTMGVWGFDGSCLHEAVVLDVSPAIVQKLLAAGAHVDFDDRAGRTALQLAVCLNRQALAQVLVDNGASEARIRPLDQAIGACFSGKSLADLSTFDSLSDDDHLWVCRAIRWGSPGIAQQLIIGGLNVNAVDDDGMMALHLAVLSGDEETCRCVIDNGGDTGTLNFEGKSAMDIAVESGASAAIVTLLDQHQTPSILRDPQFNELFEQAADAVVEGDAATLRELMTSHPELAIARSPRPHRCTLFNYLGANGFEVERQKTPANALEIIEILVGAGCDPNARCYTYRGGPGSDTLGLLLSSSFPQEAGLTFPMVSAIVAAGAETDALYHLLVDVHSALAKGQTPEISSADTLSGRAMIEAAMMGENAVVAAFLDAGVSVNVTNGTNTTALHQAAINGNEKLVQLLLDRGADASIRDDTFNGNPAGWANAGGHLDLAKRLQLLAE
jgi:ankyrin repeat protein